MTRLAVICAKNARLPRQEYGNELTMDSSSKTLEVWFSSIAATLVRLHTQLPRSLQRP